MNAKLVAGTAVSAVTALLSLSAGPTTAAPAARVDEASHDLYLDFNGRTGSTPSLESSGSAAVTTSVASSGGGTVVGVRHEGQGRAARLEPFDPDSPAELAVVVVRPSGDEDPFAPGDEAFTFGAGFTLDEVSTGSSVDDGNNLVQRGLFGDDQYKMQIDDQRLSCRVTGSLGSVTVTAGSDLEPQQWHRARCTRQGGTVTLVLVEQTADGPVKRSWTKYGTMGELSFASAPPLSVGGKVGDDGEVVKASSDQFNGRVDNVFFRRLGG